MPAPRHLRLIWSGKLGAAGAEVEEFSFGLSANVRVPGINGTIAEMDTLLAALETPTNGLMAGLTNSVRLTNIRAAMIDDDGKTMRTASGQYFQADKTTLLIGSSSTPVPFQMALAVTTLSAFDHVTGRGRFFLPCPSLGSIESDGTMTDATRAAHLTRAQTFVNAVNSALTGKSWGPVVVASGGSAAKGINAENRVVTAVKVGQRYDVQQRRAENVADDGATAAITA